MAVSYLPDVAALRDFADKFDRPVVVAFALHPKGEGYTITTYGQTRKLCKVAADFGKKVGEAVQAGRIEAPSVEPVGNTFARRIYLLDAVEEHGSGTADDRPWEHFDVIPQPEGYAVLGFRTASGGPRP